MDEILYDEITNSSNDDPKTDQSDYMEQKTWLVFKSDDAVYAVESKNITEVLRNNQVFPMPFTPNYIKGVLNFYGKPYAVVDLRLLQNLPRTNPKLFLVLNNPADIALQIDDIVDFYTSENVEEQQILERTDSDLFSQTITIGNVIAPVLDVQAIAKKVKSEIEID